jgi:DNA-binding NtrC family response regulator
LEHNGYQVLRAETVQGALAYAAEHDFQLLLTDSVMPEMSGRSAAEHIDAIRPGRPVLYMSGYSVGVLGPQRMLPEDRALIQKPFTQVALLAKVRTVLSDNSAKPVDM